MIQQLKLKNEHPAYSHAGEQLSGALLPPFALECALLCTHSCFWLSSHHYSRVAYMTENSVHDDGRVSSAGLVLLRLIQQKTHFQSLLFLGKLDYFYPPHTHTHTMPSFRPHCYLPVSLPAGCWSVAGKQRWREEPGSGAGWCCARCGSPVSAAGCHTEATQSDLKPRKHRSGGKHNVQNTYTG